VHCLIRLLQVKKEYKEKYWSKIDRDLAVQLGCLDIRLVQLYSREFVTFFNNVHNLYIFVVQCFVHCMMIMMSNGN